MVDCALNPIWIQVLATSFGMVFPQCNAGGVPRRPDVCGAGAKVADLPGQIDGHLASSGFSTTDLVTVLVGLNDILEQYALFPAVDQATLEAKLRRRGALVAEQVNRIAELDGRVMVSTVPDLGLTPFAVAEEAANPDRAALLSALTFAFNARMRATLINDGKRIGIALSDDMVQVVAKEPPTYGYANTTQAVCTVAPPDCTTATLVPGGSARRGCGPARRCCPRARRCSSARSRDAGAQQSVLNTTRARPMKHALRRFLLAGAIALVAACGGGDDDGPLYARVIVFGDSLSDVGSYRTPGVARSAAASTR